MQKMIEKASVLVEVMPYIQKFRGDTVVVKLGGSIMEHEEGVRMILRDVAFMQCAGMRPVVVHGGGKHISSALKEAGIESEFRHGLRVTTEETVRVVEHVLNHEVNDQVVQVLNSFGCEARGIHGDDITRVTRHTDIDADTGEEEEWGYVGEVESVDTATIMAFLDSHITPVITPLGRGADKKIYNVNADEAAAGVARALKARKLVFLSDVPGLLSNPEDESTLISSVNVADVPSLIERGIIGGGMKPKIAGGVKAIEAGVRKTHIIDSSIPHSLLLELFTDEGVGTEIVQ
jgi:acetylglutamate kinase